MADDDSDLDKLEVGLSHAWSWYSLHAVQRMQIVNFFLLSAAFLTAAYVTALKENHPMIAAVVAGAGALASFCFWALEARTRQLLEFGQVALISLQSRLNEIGGWTDLDMAIKAKNSAQGMNSYKEVINILTVGSLVLFILGIVNALR